MYVGATTEIISPWKSTSGKVTLFTGAQVPQYSNYQWNSWHNNEQNASPSDEIKAGQEDANRQLSRSVRLVQLNP